MNQSVKYDNQIVILVAFIFHLLFLSQYYNDEEAKKYTTNSHTIEVQSQLASRAVELLVLPRNHSCLILDIGCGSGLSGEVLSDHKHHWIGVDISRSMLNVAIQGEAQGDLILADMGQGKKKSFDD